MIDLYAVYQDDNKLLIERISNYITQVKEHKAVISNQEGIINDHRKTYLLQNKQLIDDKQEILRIDQLLSKEKKNRKRWKTANFITTGLGIATFFVLKQINK